jgi:opacity protein-like surface antigen
MVGATPALGDFGKSFKTGLHAGGFAQWGMDQGRLALRADIQLHQHDYKFGGMTWRTLATTLNALVRSPDGRGPSAYGLAGIGVYSFKASTTGARGTTDSADEIKLGFSIGAGVVRSIGSYKAFAEMRLHSAASSGSRVQFMPLSVGLIF